MFLSCTTKDKGKKECSCHVDMIARRPVHIWKRGYVLGNSKNVKNKQNKAVV